MFINRYIYKLEFMGRIFQFIVGILLATFVNIVIISFSTGRSQVCEITEFQAIKKGLNLLNPFNNMVGREWFERSTNGLKAHTKTSKKQSK